MARATPEFAALHVFQFQKPRAVEEQWMAVGYVYVDPKSVSWSIRSCPAVVLSERLQDQVQMCEIRDEVWGASDHCPLVLDIDQEAVF